MARILQGAIGVGVGGVDDMKYNFGTGDPAALSWETTDANANVLMLQLPTGGAVDVPVFALGIGIYDVDLTWFNGITQTTLALVDAARGSAIALTYRAANEAHLAFYGTGTRLTVEDDTVIALGTDGDGALTLTSAGVAANTALTNVLIGTPVTPVAIAANSLIIGNITGSGDIVLAVTSGTTSVMMFQADASTGNAIIGVLSGASFDVYNAGTKILDYANAAFAFQQATTISTTVTTLTLSPSTDVLIADAKGLVIGHTGQITVGGFLAELEVLGSGDEDSSVTQALFAANGDGPRYFFLKSRHATVGSNTIVNSGDILGLLRFIGADGVDFATVGAEIRVTVDAAPAGSQMPGRIGFFVAAGAGADDAAEALRLNSSGVLILGTPDGATTARTGKTFRASDAAAGGAGNIAGADLTIAAGLGTGTGDVGQVIFALPVVAAAGDNIQTRATRLTLDMAAGSSLYVESAGTGAAGMILKNLKNAAATALSGTQLDVEIDIGGTPYYFTVYPTKA